jgi:hypothetical protein
VITIYRPTVRYDDTFKTYVDQLFQSTTLDRNQIMRLSLFLLGHTKEGEEVLKRFLKSDTSLPSPPWQLTTTAHGLWYGSTIEIQLEGATSPKKEGETSSKKSSPKGEPRGGTSHVQKDSMERFKRETSQQQRTICEATEGTIIEGTGIIARIGTGSTILLPRRG